MVLNGTEETLIKSKRRVQKHGEVFTPKWMVEKMLNTPGVKEACETLEATFLEPGAGEGAFLVEILRRKLEMISEKYNETIKQYENYSLYALSTLYGVELLEDNMKACVVNLYQIYLDFYLDALKKHDKPRQQNVLQSAMVIAAANVRRGNFLTKKTPDDQPIIFSEWKSPKPLGKSKTINVIRTEYTFEDIINKVANEPGRVYQNTGPKGQMDLFNLFSFTENQEKEVKMKYVEVSISNVYSEEMEY